MSMTDERDVLKSETMAQQFEEMQEFVRLAAKDRRAVHVEVLFQGTVRVIPRTEIVSLPRIFFAHRLVA